MAKKTATTKNLKTLGANTALLLNARITEKAAKASDHNCYVFDVAVGATKSEIKKAFILTYKQMPTKVHIVNVKPDYIFRKNVLGKTARSKKAYIYLPKGVTIEVM